MQSDPDVLASAREKLARGEHPTPEEHVALAEDLRIDVNAWIRSEAVDSGVIDGFWSARDASGESK